MGIKVRHKVRVGGKKLAMLEGTRANICHLIVFTRNVKGDEGGRLTGPLPKGEEAEETCSWNGSSGVAFLCPTDGGSVICKHTNMLEREVFLDNL